MYPANDRELTPFFELTPDLVCIARKDGYFEKVNPAVLKCLEYDQVELFSRPIASFIHPEDQPLTSRERIKLINGKPLINFQNRYITKSGKVVWLHWTSIYFADKEVVFAIAKDVTERKLMEGEVEEKYRRFKDLATHFKHTLERDRKFLAKELHEGIAQLASVIKMDMDWLKTHLPDENSAIQRRMQHAAAVTDLMIQTIRKVSFSISPSMIEDIGLQATLSTLCKEFALLHDLSCTFKGSLDESVFAPELKLDFYRICQESLHLIQNNEEVTSVHITLENLEEDICLSIRYEGMVFHNEAPIFSSVVSGIQERVASINGQLFIIPKGAQGTMLNILVAHL